MKKVDKNTPIGTKVVAVSKTQGIRFSEGKKYMDDISAEQGFMYLNIHCDGFCQCWNKIDADDGNLYNYSDLVLYEEAPNALHEVVFPTELPPAIQDRIKELEEEVKRLKEKYEPYDIGELYAFADDADAFEKSIFVVGILEKVNIDFECPFKPKSHDCGFVYARKIKTIELCQ